MTVTRLLEAATGRLRAARIAKPRREAHRLWAWASRVSPGEAYFQRGPEPPVEDIDAFENAVRRRVAGEPMAYVLGLAGFRHLELHCDRRALIPRPETEGLVDLALERVSRGAALDLGTGSGCLALALAGEGHFERVVAVDSSAEAIALAAWNVRETGLAVDLIRADLGSSLARERFDLLVSNPPYLTREEYRTLDPGVRDWEPEAALVSGEDGLDATRALLRQGLELLRPGGWLVMELDFTRGETVRAMAGEYGWSEAMVRDDLWGRKRYLSARREEGS